jgi:tetratricopeptide (TPR) repeat protein
MAVHPTETAAKRYVKLISADLYKTDMEITDKTEKYLARADSALLRNNLMKAKNYYEKALELQPRNKQALEGLEKTNKSIREEEVYANRKKHQKEISEHWIKAVKHYDEGEFVYAKDEFNKILEIDPENAGALQYLDFIQKKVDKVTAVQSHNIFKQGLVEYEKQNYEKALSYFNAAYLSNTSRNDIKEYIAKCEEQINIAKQIALEESKKNPEKTLTNKQIEAQMKKIYDLGVEQYTLKDYEEAIKTFTKLKAMSDKHKYYTYNEQIRTYLSKSNKEVAKILYNEGRDLEMHEKLTAAYEKYKEALSYDETNSSAQKAIEKINAVTAQKYYDDGLKAFAAGDKNKAIELLKKSLEAEPTKIEASRALERIQNLK